MKMWIAVALVLVGCSNDRVGRKGLFVDGPLLLASTRAGEEGALSVISLDEKRAYSKVVPIHFDASLRSDPERGWIYVINRWQKDNIQIIDRSDFQTRREIAVPPEPDGTYANVQDVVRSGDILFISCTRKRDILRFDLNQNQFVQSISLAGLSDGDGYPEPGALHVVEDQLYVQVQRLDQRTTFWTPVAPSYIAIIHLPSLSVRSPSVKLGFTNPSGQFRLDGVGNIFVGMSGQNALESILDGGIQQFTSEWVEKKTVIQEVKLGGDLQDFVILSATLGVAVVATQPTGTALRAFNISTGELVADRKLPYSDTFDFFALALDPARNRLYLADGNTKKPAVRTFDVETLVEIDSEKYDVGLPPFDLELYL